MQIKALLLYTCNAISSVSMLLEHNGGFWCAEKDYACRHTGNKTKKNPISKIISIKYKITDRNALIWTRTKTF